MKREDKEFIFELNNCKNRQKIEELIADIDDDDLCFKMKNNYYQILEFNQDETLKEIKKILEFKYTKIKIKK